MHKSLLLLLLFSSVISFSQKNYFQQQVDYTLDVTLDDRNHILRGSETIQYKNNSSDTLRYLFFHLWPNAYKNDRTAFTEQQVENGSKAFYFSKREDRGFIDSLNFLVKGEPVNISNFNNYDDVILIELTEPLLPEKSIDITTPFRVVLPEVFSRLGHHDQDYQICQWYPKPAVYDINGWHPMPYLDQGEFYSEFGAFEVSITLPESYWVAATGILQTSSEKEAIQQRIANKEQTQSQSTQFKTLVYKQDHIHDFAWFASKDFLITQEDIHLGSRSIPCYSFFKPNHSKLYENSNRIASETITYLSEHVGTYPYGQLTLVEGITSDNAGGMEYPMLAHIGKVHSENELRTVIVHEVGHNWFYGIFGNNERDYAWMDEGINAYYEQVICERLQTLDSTSHDITSMKKTQSKFGQRFFYELVNQQHLSQAIELPSSHFTPMNYGAMVYAKFPIMFSYLKAYLGELVFEQCMKSYYNDWKFKHPQPDDIRAVFERESKQNLSWFFDDLLKTEKQLDFRLNNVIQGNVFVSSKNNFKGPIPVSAFIKDSIVQTEWVQYPYQDPAVITNTHADTYRTTFKSDWYDANPKNSFFKTKGLLKRYRLGLGFPTTFGVDEKHHVNVLPALGYNYYDRWMAGVVLHNLSIPNRAFQYAFVPMYSFGSSSFTGTGFASFTFFPKRWFYKINLGAQAKSYHFNESNLNLAQSLYTRFIKVNPFLQFELKPTFARSSVRKNIMVSAYLIHKEGFHYVQDATDSLYRPEVEKQPWKAYGYARYKHENNRTFNPFSYELDAIGNPDFLKLRLTANLKIDYHYLNKAFYVRFFAGKFFELISENNAYQLQDQVLTATYGASNDFLYNESYIARSEQDHWSAKQISMYEGGMKIRTSFLANPIGRNSNWLTAVNFRSDLPIKSKVKIQLFLDLATYHQAASLNNSGNKLIYDAGVEWHFLNDLLVWYVPLLNCKDYKDYLKSTYQKNRLLQSMTFSLNLHKFNWLNSQQAVTRFLN